MFYQFYDFIDNVKGPPIKYVTRVPSAFEPLPPLRTRFSILKAQRLTKTVVVVVPQEVVRNRVPFFILLLTPSSPHKKFL